MVDQAKMVDGILVRAKRLMEGLEVQVWGKENREERACLGTEQNLKSGSGNVVRVEGELAVGRPCGRAN